MKTKLIFYSLLIVFSSLVLSGCATVGPNAGQNTRISISTLQQLPFDVRVARANIKQEQDYSHAVRHNFIPFTLLEFMYTEVGNNVVGNEVGFSRIVSLTNLPRLSEDQKQFVQLLGLPEFCRSFVTIRGNRITEWVYLTQDYLIQFNYGVLVYVGPVDDLEKTLINLGAPDEHYTVNLTTGRQEIFFYKTRLLIDDELNGEIKVFQNDKLINTSEFYPAPESN
jgi:hypothetical protein